MARSLSGEASAPEKADLYNTLSENSLLQQQCLLLQKFWSFSVDDHKVSLNDKLSQILEKATHLHKENLLCSIRQVPFSIENAAGQSGTDNRPASMVKTQIPALKKKNHSATASLYHHLTFKGERFEKLAARLEEYFDIKITFMDQGVKKLNFYGSYTNGTAAQFFAALKAAVPFNFKIHAHDVSVSSQ